MLLKTEKNYSDPVTCHPNVCHTLAPGILDTERDFYIRSLTDPDFTESDRADIARRYAEQCESQIEWKQQRQTRGFDSTELWNFDTTICEWLVPRLKAFREENFGYPGNMTYEDWNKILDEMIEGFEAYIQEGPDTKSLDETYEFEMQKLQKCQKAFDLLAEHFSSLWW